MRTDGFQGVIFDLDGTLIDSYEAIRESLNHALGELGHTPADRESVRRMVGRGLEVLIARAMRLDLERDADRVALGVRLFREKYDAVCVRGTRLLPEVGPTLALLHGRGYSLAVATNKPSYFAIRLLDALGVGPRFRTVVGPDLVELPKPDPGIVHAARRTMGLARDETLYVGDMEVDVQTARAAGLSVIVMPTGSSDRETLESAGADLIVDSFGDLGRLLAGPSVCRPS